MDGFCTVPELPEIVNGDCPPHIKNSLEARLPAAPKGISYEWSEEILCGTRTKSSVSQEEFLLLVLAESLET